MDANWNDGLSRDCIKTSTFRVKKSLYDCPRDDVSTHSGNDDHDLSVILHYHRLEHGFAYFLFEKFLTCISLEKREKKVSV